MSSAAPKTYSINDNAATNSISSLYGLTPAELQTLHGRSAAARATAYCPYSKFRVGATLLSRDGRWTDGANVENASYPVGTCAERVAFGAAVVGGVRGFKAVGVATDIDDVCSPCGACRQFIREFCELDMPIFMFNAKGNYAVLKLGELLPLSFGPDVLPSPDVLEAGRA